MELIQRIFVFISLMLFALSFAFSLSSLFTDFWVEVNGLERNGTLSVNSFVHSGLFRGSRQIEWSFAPRYTQFSVFDEVRGGGGFIGRTELIFIIFLIILGILWTTIGLLVALLNTAIQSFNDVTGPFGLCVWSLFAAISNVSAIFLFLHCYFNSISNNILLPEHLNAGFSSKNKTSLGFSFWLLIAGVVAQFLPALLMILTAFCRAKSDTNSLEKDMSKSHVATILMY